MARKTVVLTSGIISSSHTVTKRSVRVKLQQPADSLQPHPYARSAVTGQTVRRYRSVTVDAVRSSPLRTRLGTPMGLHSSGTTGTFRWNSGALADGSAGQSEQSGEGSIAGAATTIDELLAESLIKTVADAGSLDPACAKEVFQRLTKIADVAARQKQRLVGGLAADMRNQRQLADALGLSQAQISRILTAHQSKPEVSPTEIIDQRDAGVIDDAQMLAQLTGLEYSYDRFPNAGSIGSAAYVPGTWNEIEEAFATGRITRDQYIAVMDAHRDEIVAAAEHS